MLRFAGNDGSFYAARAAYHDLVSELGRTGARYPEREFFSVLAIVEARDIARAVTEHNMKTDAEAIESRPTYELTIKWPVPGPRKNGEPLNGWRIIDPDMGERRLNSDSSRWSRGSVMAERHLSRMERSREARQEHGRRAAAARWHPTAK